MECHLLWVRFILTKKKIVTASALFCEFNWKSFVEKNINCMSDSNFGCEWKFRIMSDVEISLPFSKFVNQNKLTGANNNNNNSATKHKSCNSELELRRSASPRIVISKNLVLMSPESSARHSPNQNNTNSLSPATSVSPRTMSPSPEQRISISNYNSDGYQPNYVNPLQSYQTTAMPPKKSFCIDALLSKNNQNGDHSPDANRFSNDEDVAHKYHDDQREYASSPDDGNSRWVKVDFSFVPNPCRRMPKPNRRRQFEVKLILKPNSFTFSLQQIWIAFLATLESSNQSRLWRPNARYARSIQKTIATDATTRVSTILQQLSIPFDATRQFSVSSAHRCHGQANTGEWKSCTRK